MSGIHTCLLPLLLLLSIQLVDSLVEWQTIGYYSSSKCTGSPLYQQLLARSGTCINTYKADGSVASSQTWRPTPSTTTTLLSGLKKYQFEVYRYDSADCRASPQPKYPLTETNECTACPLRSAVSYAHSCAAAGASYQKIETQSSLHPPPPVLVAPSLVQWGYSDYSSCKSMLSPLSIIAYPPNACIPIDARHAMRYTCNATGTSVTLSKYSNRLCQGTGAFISTAALPAEGECIQYGDASGTIARRAPAAGDSSANNFVTFSCCLQLGTSSCSLYAPTAVPTASPTVVPTFGPTYALGLGPPTEAPSPSPGSQGSPHKNSGHASKPGLLLPAVSCSLLYILLLGRFIV